jgi:hypothetical protein
VSSVFVFGGNAPVNRADTFEHLGFGTDGALTTLTGGAANAPGSPGIDFGATANDWAGFDVFAHTASVSADRCLVDVATDSNFTNIIAPKLPFQPSTNQAQRIFVPLNVPAGTHLYVRYTCSAGPSHTLQAGIRGRIKNANSPPCYSSMVQLDTGGNATTNFSSADLSLSTLATAAWQILTNSTADAYDAFMVCHGPGSVTPSSVHAAVRIALATGATPTEIGDYIAAVQNQSVQTGRAELFEVPTVPAGTPIRIGAFTASPGTDKIRANAWGLKK